MWSNLPMLLAEAAKTPLGISALVILVLAILAYGLFRRENSRIKTRIYLLIFIGFITIAITIKVTENIPENISKNSQEAAYLLYLGDQFSLADMNDESEEKYIQARNLFETAQDNNGLANALLKLGKLELSKGETIKALDYFGKSQKYFEESNDLIGKNNVVLNINIINRGGKDTLRKNNIPDTGLARNVSELANYVVHNSELNLEKSEKIVDVLFGGITKTLAAGYEVRLVGFGTFSVAYRAASRGQNPSTGEVIQIPASSQPKFKAGKSLKDAVNQ